MKMQPEQLILNITFLALGIVFLITSVKYPFGAGLFPFLVAAITIGLVVYSFIYGRKKLGHQNAGPARGSDRVAEAESGEIKAAMRGFLWLLGLVLALRFIDYILAISLFVLLTLKLEAHLSWRKAMVLAACLGGLVYIIFIVILGSTNL